MMGLAERFIERGQVVRQLRFYSEGKCLVSLEFARCGSRFGFLLDLPQDETERLLRARIAELGGVVENGTELTGLTAGADGVTAAVRDPAGPGADDHRRVRGRLRRRAQPGPARARPDLPRAPLPAGLAARRRPAGLGPARRRGTRVLPARRAAGDLLPDARPPVAADAALRGQPGRAGSHPGGDPAADRPADAAAGHRVRSHLAGQLPLPSPVGQRLPARPRAAGRRRGAHPHPGRRPGPEHRDHGRAQPGLEARPGRRRPGARRAARQLRHRTAPGGTRTSSSSPTPWSTTAP